MAAYIIIYCFSGWGFGYALGYQVRMIRSVYLSS